KILLHIKSDNVPTIPIHNIAEFNSIVQGIHQTTSITRKLARFGKELTPEQRKQWIPLFRGQDFNRFVVQPPEVFERYLNPSHWNESYQGPWIVWRSISRATDQFSMIISLLPTNVNFDNSTYGIQCLDTRLIPEALALIGSIPFDFIIKLFPNPNRTKAQITQISIPNYRTHYLTQARTILAQTLVKGKNPSQDQITEIDALMWCHYTFNRPDLDRDLEEIMTEHYATWKRNNPDQVQQFIQKVRQVRRPQEQCGYDPTPIFTSRKQNQVTSLKSIQVPNQQTDGNNDKAKPNKKTNQSDSSRRVAT
ncbi:MAG: hypothetical protein NZ480_07285, partial [Bdellovibrionaceae bacterium]|nr:hypothetical protein [Pseudobdellovibrionaceae bacterium]